MRSILLDIIPRRFRRRSYLWYVRLGRTERVEEKED